MKRKTMDEIQAMQSNFDLEVQWEMYVHLNGLHALDPKGVQHQETKKAWYGGFSQLMNLIQFYVDDDGNGEKGVMQLEDMYQQCKMFWNKFLPDGDE